MVTKAAEQAGLRSLDPVALAHPLLQFALMRWSATIVLGIWALVACDESSDGAALDAGNLDGGTADGGANDCSAPNGTFDDREHLSFAGPAGETVELYRKRVAQGAGFSVIYEPRSLWVVRAEHEECMQSDLHYDNSHHNWLDHAVGIGSDGITYDLAISFQPEGGDPLGSWVWTYTLRGTRHTQEAFAPIALTLVRGTP